MDIKVRRALPGEADVLSDIAFTAKAHWGYPERWMELWKPQLTFGPEYLEENESWVAEADGAPIAFYTWQDKEGSAWLENLFVSPEWMGQDIGRKLFSHAVALSRQRGYRILRLEADPNAVGFYEKMGMHRIGERRSEVEGHLRVLPIMEL